MVALSAEQGRGGRKADEYVRIEVLFWHEDEVANAPYIAGEIIERTRGTGLSRYVGGQYL